jgi:hypothetical protein
MNPDFFKGTIVEEAAQKEIAAMGMLTPSPKIQA